MASLQQLQALLANQGGGAGLGGPLAQFKAGKLSQSGTTIKADPRKGEVVIEKGDDGLLHFKWLTRPSGTQENDWIIFPNDGTSWERVDECKDGRVYLLTLAGNRNQRHFFWLQEPKEDKDKECEDKIKELVKNTGGAGAGGQQGQLGLRGLGGLGGLGGMGVDDQAALLSMFQGRGAQQQQEQQSSSSAAAAASGPAAASSTASSSAASSSAAAPASSSSAAAAPNAGVADALAQAFSAALRAGGQQSQANLTPEEKFMQTNEHSLAETLDPEAVIEILGSSQEMLDKLLPHLPDGQRTHAALMENLRSPQLRQTLNRIQAVLSSGESAGLLSQLGLPVVNEIGVKALVESIKKSVEDEKKKDDEGGDGAAPMEDDKDDAEK